MHSNIQQVFHFSYRQTRETKLYNKLLNSCLVLSSSFFFLIFNRNYVQTHLIKHNHLCLSSISIAKTKSVVPQNNSCHLNQNFPTINCATIYKGIDHHLRLRDTFDKVAPKGTKCSKNQNKLKP